MALLGGEMLMGAPGGAGGNLLPITAASPPMLPGVPPYPTAPMPPPVDMGMLQRMEPTPMERGMMGLSLLGDVIQGGDARFGAAIRRGIRGDIHNRAVMEQMRGRLQQQQYEREKSVYEQQLAERQRAMQQQLIGNLPVQEQLLASVLPGGVGTYLQNQMEAARAQQQAQAEAALKMRIEQFKAGQATQIERMKQAGAMRSDLMDLFGKATPESIEEYQRTGNVSSLQPMRGAGVIPPEKVPTTGLALGKEYRAEGKGDRAVLTTWQNVQGLDPATMTPQEDHALTMAFAHAWDPNSIVQKSEADVIAQLGKNLPWLRSAWANYVTGTSLTETQRRNMLDSIYDKAQQSRNRLQPIHSRYTTIAKDLGVPQLYIGPDELPEVQAPMTAIQPGAQVQQPPPAPGRILTMPNFVGGP